MLDQEHTTKLIESKIRFAQQQRFMDSAKIPDNSGRLPPGQSKVNGLPVLDLGIHPDISLDDWKLVIDGCVECPLAIDWKVFQALEQVNEQTDIHCVTSWSSFDNQWGGVRLSTLLEIARPAPHATHAMLHGYDGYTTNVAIADLLEENCLVATSWNGESLSSSHGAPARIVIPHRYFWKSAKWIARIEFLAKDAPGYWEQRGYHNDGDPWDEQRYGKRPTPALTTAAGEPAGQTVTQQIPAEMAAVPSPLAKLKAWITYHFFPD